MVAALICGRSRSHTTSASQRATNGPRIRSSDAAGVSKAIEDFVLNIPKKTGISEVVKYKLPSAGSLLMGYYLGLRRG